LSLQQQSSINYSTSGSDNTTADAPLKGRLCALDGVTGAPNICCHLHLRQPTNSPVSLSVASLHRLLDLFSSENLTYEVFRLLAHEVFGRSENVNVTFDTFSSVQQLYNGMTISCDRVEAEALQVLVNNSLTYVAHFLRPAIQSHENMSVDSTATCCMGTTSNTTLSSNTTDTSYSIKLASINGGGNASTLPDATQGMCSRCSTDITGIDTFAFVRT
jgi:hypothetical protein